MIDQSAGVEVSGDRRAVNSLAAIQSFETLWAYYSQSSGALYDSECRAAAEALVAASAELIELDDEFAGWISSANINKIGALSILDALRDWSTSSRPAPFETLSMARARLFGLLAGMKIYLHMKLQIPFTPRISMSAKEIEYSERRLRWKGYLPEPILTQKGVNPDVLVEEASAARTIALVGDIRNSQKLMGALQNADRFARFMGDFIAETRALIDKRRGFFDKFTGDGFIVYFNERICEVGGVDFIDALIDFSREIKESTAEILKSHARGVSQRALNSIGLALGADIGRVDFRDVNNHLIAIGDAVVWAHRMSAVGSVGDFIARAPLAREFEGKIGVRMKPRGGLTKHGLAFKAKAVKIVGLFDRSRFTLDETEPIKIETSEPSGEFNADSSRRALEKSP